MTMAWTKAVAPDVVRRDSYPLSDAVAHERTVRHGQDIRRLGELRAHLTLLVAGYACRYRMLAHGRRQIMAVLVPGDGCDLDAVLLGRSTYGVAALTPCTLGDVPLPRLPDLIAREPGLAEVLWRRGLRDQAIATEWMVGLGQRTALERVAHLLCELWTRLDAVGLARADGFDLRLTQVEIADVLGLSNVHVNRTLQELRRAGRIVLQGSRLTVQNRAALERLAEFDPGYLRA